MKIHLIYCATALLIVFFVGCVFIVTSFNRYPAANSVCTCGQESTPLPTPLPSSDRNPFRSSDNPFE